MGEGVLCLGGGERVGWGVVEGQMGGGLFFFYEFQLGDGGLVLGGLVGGFGVWGELIIYF